MVRLNISKEWFKRNINSIIPIVFTIAVIVGFQIYNPVFLSSEGIVTLTYRLSAFLIAACALTFVIMMGSFDFSVPNLLRLATIICVVSLKRYPGPWIIPAALATCLILGFLNGILVARFNIPSFMATLSVSVIAEGIAFLYSRGWIYIVTDPLFKAISTTFILGLPSIFYWAIAVWLICVFIALATPFGRKVYAIGGNLTGSVHSGVNVKMVRICVFTFSGFLSGLAGVLYASQWGGGAMSTGTAMTLPLFASVVLGGTALTGGTGGPHRTMLGAIIATWIQAGLAMQAIDPLTQNIVFGIIALIMVALTIDRKRIKIIK
jgi:ribose transport system permease protein/putative xylitol transport system permease protein